MKNPTHILIVLVALLLVAAIAVACSIQDDQPPIPVGSSEIHEVNWVLINAPPGVEGPCYAFFYKETMGSYFGFGYSGVYCIP